MRPSFLDGCRAALPILVSTAPLAMLFGAIAVSRGQTVFEATLMSGAIFAGASQFVGLELFDHAIPAWLIVLSVFAVNFRHILYSAAISPLLSHFAPWQKYLSFFLLTDPQFALTLARGESGLRVSFAWYMGLGLAIYSAWTGLTLVGALFGTMLGDTSRLGIDVLLPVYFMGLVFGFRHRANFLPIVIVSAAVSIAAEHYVGSPWHVSIGAFAGILLAAILPPKRDGDPSADERTAEADRIAAHKAGKEQSA